eukprot:gnl/Spiro4/12021_TR6338_c0_g1_i1.p1 gnl/Spiro4/12021_TR6338_c0_g1~~gnl/Spiro4/12021_TR6338_c0_g1_i1.p1  ORF type:complete len:861 (+),score=232.02 gnl/Spiro4/12021_TR6338_c0_g1_i1:121-2703(+)
MSCHNNNNNNLPELHVLAGHPQNVEVFLAVGLANFALKPVYMNPDERQHKTKEFLAWNPLGRLPVLVVSANSAPLSDSRAICSFVAVSAGLLSTWDKKRLVVESWLEWNERSLIPQTKLLYPSLSGVTDFDPALVEAQRTALVGQMLPHLEAALSRSAYLADNDLTLADVTVWSSLFPALSHGGLLQPAVVAPWPRLAAWFENCAKTFVPLLQKADISLGKTITYINHHALDDVPRSAIKYVVQPIPNKTVYITTPIYYVNGEPHIGHVFTTLLSDALAAWYRVKGCQVFLCTGTDEHGSKVAQSAAKKGLEPIKFCDQVSNCFRSLFDKLGFKYDRFIRTTEDVHVRTVVKMWNRLERNGHIVKGVHEGWYCVSDENFCTELQVEDRIIDGKSVKVSIESGRPVEWCREENYLFKLSNFQQPLLDWLEANPKAVVPRIRQREVVNFIRAGLNDLSITRTNVAWGITCPSDPTHTIYVWLDALTNYLTAAGFGDSEEATGAPLWPCDYHLVGKDILRFHAIFWPAFLMGAGVAPPKQVVAHGWWTKDGEKIAKSSGNAFDVELVADFYGMETLRYFLLREADLSMDGDITFGNIRNRNNNDLADDLGNLVTRLLGLVAKGDIVPRVPLVEGTVPQDTATAELINLVFDTLPGEVDHHFCEVNFKEGLSCIWQAVYAVNRYINCQAPWKLMSHARRILGKANDDPPVSFEAVRGVGASSHLSENLDAASVAELESRCTTDSEKNRLVLALLNKHNFIIYVALECVRAVAILAAPVLPRTSEQILCLLGLQQKPHVSDCRFGVLAYGAPLPHLTATADKSSLILFTKKDVFVDPTNPAGAIQQPPPPSAGGAKKGKGAAKKK